MHLPDSIPAAVPFDRSVVIVVREQVSATDSSYRQSVKRGGVCTLTDYLDAPRDGRLPLFRLDHFEHDRLAELYLELLGRDRVHVLIFEELRQDHLFDLGLTASGYRL